MICPARDYYCQNDIRTYSVLSGHYRCGTARESNPTFYPKNRAHLKCDE